MRVNEEGRGKKRSLIVRTSMGRSDKWMVNETLHQTSNITNASTSEDEDSVLQKDRFHGRGWENWAYFTHTPSIARAWRPQSAFADGEVI